MTEKIAIWEDGDFLRPVFQASSVQHISDMHSKFTLRPHRVRSMVDIQSATDEIRRGIKKIERTRNVGQCPQHDGRPAEYRWRPLFNAANFADAHY